MTNQKTSILDTLVDWRDDLDTTKRFIDKAEITKDPGDFIVARRRINDIQVEMTEICKKIIAARAPVADTQSLMVITLDVPQEYPHLQDARKSVSP